MFLVRMTRREALRVLLWPARWQWVPEARIRPDPADIAAAGSVEVHPAGGVNVAGGSGVHYAAGGNGFPSRVVVCWGCGARPGTGHHKDCQVPAGQRA